MNTSVRTGLILSVGLLGGAMLSLTHGVLADREPKEMQSIPFEELRNFTHIYSRIKSDYVEQVDDTTLLENAIRGMLSGLDPHSSYLNPQEYQELRIGTTGQFGGLGIQVGMDDGFVKVISPIDDTPAFRAGIQAGDMIIRLDDKLVKGMTLDEAVKLMRGKPGTDITLTIVREGVEKPFKVTITRDIIKVKSVRGQMLEPGFGYLRISQFQADTATNLAKELKNLKKEAENSLHGLVLDLRNNPGGVLNASAEVADLFLNAGKIVYTEGRIENSDVEFNARKGDMLDGAPIIVLINGGSASASEIVAGALQDHKRAIIMGTKSFGKGSVQTIQELPGGGAVKLTTARYYTPQGRSIQADGITPDIVLDRLNLTAADEHEVRQIKESDLSGHLKNPNGSNGSPAEHQDKDQPVDITRDDYQLHEALILLKGLHISRERQQQS